MLQRGQRTLQQLANVLVAAALLHLQRVGIENPRIRTDLGVTYDRETISNMPEVIAWARELESDGPRIGPWLATLPHQRPSGY